MDIFFGRNFTRTFRILETSNIFGRLAKDEITMGLGDVVGRWLVKEEPYSVVLNRREKSEKRMNSDGANIEDGIGSRICNMD